MKDFFLRNLLQIYNGGSKILIRKLKKLFRLFFTFIFYLPSIILFTLPIILLIKLIKPIIIIRFQEILSSRIGHFAGNLDLYIEEKKNYINISRSKKHYFDIFFLDGKQISNLYLLTLWKKKIFFFPRFICFPIYKFLILIKELSHIIGNNTQSDRDVNNLLENAKPNILLNSQEKKIGFKYLEKLGIKKDQKIICLNVRDNAYLPELAYHNYRDGKIDDYIYAAEYLTKKGYFVFRMGKKVSETLNIDNPKIIDYASSPDRSDFLDIFLASRCEFCISTSSGFDALCTIFRKPIAFVTVPIGYIYTFNKKYISITKHHVDMKTNRKLSSDEVSDRNCFFALNTKQYKINSIKLIDNNKEEILNLCKEMINLINDNFNRKPSIEEKIFWEKYKNLVKDYKQNGLSIHGNYQSYFSNQFLKNNKYILS